MLAQDLHYSELVEVGQRIAKRELSSVEATQAQLDRIARLDGQLKSYAYVMSSSALEPAQAAEKEIAAGKVRGPLHGVPIAVKDLCWTKNAPTAAGMRIYRNNRPTEDATVVARLKEAGAVILGKLQLTEGAYADHHPDIEPPRNPWDATLWSGASSSGSARRPRGGRFARRPRPPAAAVASLLPAPHPPPRRGTRRGGRPPRRGVCASAAGAPRPGGGPGPVAAGPGKGKATRPAGVGSQ